MISPMRWGLRLSLVLAIGAGVHASPTVAQEVNWRDDYKKAREEAVATDRPLFIDLGTENCHWCKQLDLKTFRDPAIIVLLNERFVPLKIDGQKVPALVEAIRVQMYPTLVFATPGGAILSFQEGFVEAPALRQELQRTLLAVFTPEWMNNDFKTATEASEKGDYARAVSLLKDIVEDGKDRPIQAKARRLLKEVEEQAAVRFSRARQLADKGQNTEAMKAMNELVKTFPGTQAAREGSQFLFTLASRSKPDDPQRARRAKELLHQAKEDYRRQQFLFCLERCDTLTTLYADLPEGAEATQLLAEINGNAEWMKQACEQLGDRMCTMYLALADTWLKQGQTQQAVFYLERVIQAFPNTRHAETAEVRLMRIQRQPLPTTK